MAELQLLLESAALRVVRFRVHEEISRLFEIALRALSPDENIAFDAVVGRAAEFRLVTGYAHSRRAGARRATSKRREISSWTRKR
ncbi:MAG: hypothetical protein HY744_20010, partial [Deltaproteobacteria bacterium]|nr:hypothetical protein [Deltaproteobacteria bacterium]